MVQKTIEDGKDLQNNEHLPFEEAMAQLETIVRSLEGGNITLEDAVTAYERGAWLKKQCEARLNEAKLRIDKIVGGNAVAGFQTETTDAE